MNSVVTERFIECHKHLKEEGRIRSSRQFAMALDYLPQNLSDILNGRRDVTLELLRKAIELYQLNPVYLFTGNGPLFMTEEDQKSLKVLTIVTNPQEEEQIVFVPANVQEIYAKSTGKPNFINELPRFTLPGYHYKTNSFRAFEVAGDELNPTLVAGDRVVCSYVEPSLWLAAIQNDYVYVIVTTGSILVRRVHNKLNDSGKSIELLADDPQIPLISLKMQEIVEVWLVKHKISIFNPTAALNEAYRHQGFKELKQQIAQQSSVIQGLQQSIEELAYKTEDQ